MKLGHRSVELSDAVGIPFEQSQSCFELEPCDRLLSAMNGGGLCQ